MMQVSLPFDFCFKFLRLGVERVYQPVPIHMIAVNALFDTGEELAEKTAPFDAYIQIIDGSAEITINDKNYVLKLGEGIVIPAHASHSINAKEQFKMVSTVIKSGYDE